MRVLKLISQILVFIACVYLAKQLFTLDEIKLINTKNESNESFSHDLIIKENLLTGAFNKTKEEASHLSLITSQIIDAGSDILLSIGTSNKLDMNFTQSPYGFEIIDYLESLRTIRVRVDDPVSFAQFLADNGDGFEFEQNVRLKLPAVPEQRILEAEEPFSGHSMNWLGAKNDRRESGHGIKVAILDTGIDINHESLYGLDYSEVSLLDNGIDAGIGHGTGIASIIAGQTDEFLGLAPSSEVLSVKVLNSDGVGDSFTIAKGIILAVDQGSDIINLSLGGFSSSAAMDQAIQYAKSKDVLLVSAVGNDRTEGIGQVSQEDAIAYGFTGPNLRASGVDLDLRKDKPYSGYEKYDFDVPIGTRGDCYDRYLVRIEEVRQSLRIIKQVISDFPSGLWYAEDAKKIFAPPKEKILTSMEELIQNFMIVTEGPQIPAGEVYFEAENPKGALGFYIVSKGGGVPYRLKIRAPSFCNLSILEKMVPGHMLSDITVILGSLDFVMGECDR